MLTAKTNTRRDKIAEKTAALKEVYVEMVTECAACAQLMVAQDLAVRGLAQRGKLHVTKRSRLETCRAGVLAQRLAC